MYYFYKDSLLSRLSERFLQLLFPMGTYCVCCGKYIDLTRMYCICDQCMESINWGYIYIDLDEERRKSGRTCFLDSALSCMVYGLHSKRLVFDLKYNGKTYISRAISKIMADRLILDESLKDLTDRLDLVVPVPLHSEKEKERGFNQAALIASELTKRLSQVNHSIRYSPCLLRSKETLAQKSVTGAQRFSNLEGAFSLDQRHASSVKGSVVLLVDDIFTTGATADHCSRILKEYGAREVHLISLATGNNYLKGAFRPRDDEEFLDPI